MMAWRHPAALGALTLLVLPLLIHLLRQHRARRQPFPTLRFVVTSQSAASRWRRVSDPGLLALRMAILAAAVAAVAEPLVVVPRRLDAWNARVARAIVIDTGGTAETGMRQAAHDAADAESRDAAAVMRFESADLGQGIIRAARWLGTAPPARREIVIVSPFPDGALSPADLAAVPPPIGVRFVAAGTLPRARQFAGHPLAGGGSQAVALTPDTTEVAIAAGTGSVDGLTLVGVTDDEPAFGRLLRAMAAAGTPAPSPAEPIVVVFPGGAVPPGAAPLRAWWMRAAVVRLSRDSGARAAIGIRDAQESPIVQAPWITVLADRGGRPLVQAAAADAALVLTVHARPSTYVAAAVAQAALRARAPMSSFVQQEVRRIPAEQLEAWRRPPAPQTGNDALHSEVSDARWLWALALTLLGLESWVRRRPIAQKVDRAGASHAA